MRRKLIAGNWKMNKSFAEAEELIADIADAIDDLQPKNVDIVLCPPAPYLEMATDIAAESEFAVGAQNVYPADSGAFTGEISPMMLSALEVAYCIVGHSERRKYFNEDHDFLARKVDALLGHSITPIFCCGEVLPEREAGAHFEVVKRQLAESLFHLSDDEIRNVVIAYEPVWAIGTGVNATPEQAQEMHAFIRELILKQYGIGAANEAVILYGGSCNASNAKVLFSQPDVDGGLIGGASLKSDEFMNIVLSA